MVNGVFRSPWTVEAKLGITDWALGLLWTAKGKYGTADGALGSLGTVEGKYGMADGALEYCPVGDRWRAAGFMGLCIVPGSSFVCGRGLFPGGFNREAKTEYAASHKARVLWNVGDVL